MPLPSAPRQHAHAVQVGLGLTRRPGRLGRACLESLAYPRQLEAAHFAHRQEGDRLLAAQSVDRRRGDADRSRELLLGQERRDVTGARRDLSLGLQHLSLGVEHLGLCAERARLDAKQRCYAYETHPRRARGEHRRLLIGMHVLPGRRRRCLRRAGARSTHAPPPREEDRAPPPRRAKRTSVQDVAQDAVVLVGRRRRERGPWSWLDVSPAAVTASGRDDTHVVGAAAAAPSADDRARWRDPHGRIVEFECCRTRQTAEKLNSPAPEFDGAPLAWAHKPQAISNAWAHRRRAGRVTRLGTALRAGVSGGGRGGGDDVQRRGRLDAEGLEQRGGRGT